MIISLKYNLKFSSTGKQFAQEIKFQPGLTVISGANEKGKSLILEMIEYAWFGVAALRGQASDYDTIEVDMTWETKGQTYTVSRHGSTQNLNKNKAVGAKAVNAEIISILGIDLPVFRIACSAKQGELDKLTARMAPTERRKMVDEVIGLNQLEGVEKLCRSEANASKRLRDDLAKRAIEPEPPVEPEGYIPSEDLTLALHAQIRSEAEREQLLKLTKPTLPAEPVKGEFGDDIESYESLRKKEYAEREGIERTLRTIPTATFSRQDTEYARAFYDQEKLGPYPIIALEDVNKYLADWDTIDQADKLVECPECHTKFVPGGDKLVVPHQPMMDRQELRTQLRAHDKWGDRKPTLFRVAPVMAERDIAATELALAQSELRERLEADLALIPTKESREPELKAKLEWEKDTVTYQSKLDIYLDNLTKWIDAQARLAELPESDINLENKLHTAQIYEEQKRLYDANMIVFERTNDELLDLNKTVEAYNNGAEALKYVRSQIKQHLVPSLNRVASHLLSEMTNGQRTKIVVDENFEVDVDGQPVRTLSGSGSSAVNLALRIALGQVLTQKVIPIFLGDELDHDCDADRAAAIHQALQQVSKTLKQVIIVSHRAIDGDNSITL